MPNRAIKVPANSISSVYATKNDIFGVLASVTSEMAEHQVKSTVHLDLVRRRTLQYTCQVQDNWEIELAKVIKKLDELVAQVAKLTTGKEGGADIKPEAPPAPPKATPPFDNIVDLVGNFDGNPLQLSKWTRKVDEIWYANGDADYRKALLKALPKALAGKANIWLARLGMQFRLNKPWPIWKLSLAAFSGGIIDRVERDSGLTLPEFPDSLKMLTEGDEDDEGSKKGKKSGSEGKGDGDDDENKEVEFCIGDFMRFFSQ